MDELGGLEGMMLGILGGLGTCWKSSEEDVREEELVEASRSRD